MIATRVGPGCDIAIDDNLFADVDGKAWGGPRDFLQIGGGAADVRVERNAVQQTGRTVSAYGKPPMTGFTSARTCTTLTA